MSLPNTPKARQELIANLQTANGGFTKDTLATLGVPWPPPKGWKADLVKNGKLTK